MCFNITVIISTTGTSGLRSNGAAQSNLSLSTTLLATDPSLKSKIHAVSSVHLSGLPKSSFIIHDTHINRQKNNVALNKQFVTFFSYQTDTVALTQFY